MADKLIEITEILRRVPIFSHMDPVKLKLLVFSSDRLDWNAGDYVFHHGDSADCAYLILSGSVDVVSEANGQEVVLTSLEKHELLGEIAILCDIPRTAGIRAREDLTMLKIRKDHFFNLVSQNPEVGIPIMKELALRIEATTRMLAEANMKLGQYE